MKFNEESFKKAISECKIIRWENHFKNVVKAYLKAESEQCNIANVSQQRELLIADFIEKYNEGLVGNERIHEDCLKDYLQGNL